MLHRTRFSNKTSDCNAVIRYEMKPGESFSYESVYDEFCIALENNAKRFLIDKRQFETAVSDNIPTDTAKKFGDCLGKHGAKLAIVLDEKDHVGKVIGLALMQAGAQVLSTFEMAEAVKWLDDEIK